MDHIGRRHFLGASLGAAAAVVASPKRAFSANDKITVAVLGLGNRGSSHVRAFTEREDVDVAWVCDVDASRFERVQGILDQAGRPSPKTSQDFRKALDDKSVDAVVIATNHHWQALTAILACQAGKDCYLEKPGSHDAVEAWKTAEAAQKYQRIVQLGAQNRSPVYAQEARELVQSGKLGKLHMVRVLSMNSGRIRAKGPDTQAPSTLDWDMWCGPAPVQPFAPGTWHVNRFDFGVGRIVDDLVHQADMMRYVTGIGFPKSVTNTGGVFHYKDGREWPDTQLTTFEYPELTVIFQSTLWAEYIRETPSVIRDGDQFPNWLLNGVKIELFGTEGMMLLGRQGGGYQVYDNDRKLVSESYGRQGSDLHMTNFLECVRSRKPPIADIGDAWKSSLLCHLGNLSYRTGNRKLEYDAATNQIKGDAEANALMGRKGRAPWVIPDVV